MSGIEPQAWLSLRDNPHALWPQATGLGAGAFHVVDHQLVPRAQVEDAFNLRHKAKIGIR